MFALVVLLSGCGTLQNWIPSFWDDNQSRSIINIRSSIERIDCDQPQVAQITPIEQELQWFTLYSQSKGTLQKDVLRLVEPMDKTVAEWVKRGDGSRAYCGVKKKILQQQGQRAAAVILGRW